MKLCYSKKTVFSYNVRSYPWFTVKDLKEHYSFNSRINVFSLFVFQSISSLTKHNILLLAHMRLLLDHCAYHKYDPHKHVYTPPPASKTRH